MAEIEDRKPGDKPKGVREKLTLKRDLQLLIQRVNENFHETGERQIIKSNLYSALEMWDRLEEIE